MLTDQRADSAGVDMAYASAKPTIPPIPDRLRRVHDGGAAICHLPIADRANTIGAPNLSN